ncbi:hypothetical protein A6R68_14503, partial [Neotoma lepida]
PHYFRKSTKSTSPRFCPPRPPCKCRRAGSGPPPRAPAWPQARIPARSLSSASPRPSPAVSLRFSDAQPRRGPLGALGVGVVAACGVLAVPLLLSPAVLHLAERPLPVGLAV